VVAYLIVFVACAATTFVATPAVRRIVVRYGAIDEPNDRKVHPVATPTMGGLAMYVGVVVGLAVSYRLPFFSDVHAASPEPVATFVTCTLIVALGAIDDLRGIMALTKFTGQVFVAGVLILMGMELSYFWLPGLGIFVLLGSDMSVLITILWVVAFVNAVNLVDGLDGLAAGMVAIAAGAFFLYMTRSPSPFGDASEAALLAAVTAGVCVGFLPWNFNPAKIFMGDSGSMLLGLLLAISTISGVGRNPYSPSTGDFAAIAIPLLVPLLVLFIPFLDVLLAIVRRVRRRQGIGVADKEHIHHRLLDIGHSHKQAVMLMYLWSALISGSALAIGLIDGRFAAGLVLAGAGLLFLITALPRLIERRRNGDGAPPDEGVDEEQPPDGDGRAAAPAGPVSDTPG
jgi:UDP-GlcNAc:undecaprenyl-phosphate GlcNAc-1-phosphate transferase